MAKIGKTPGYGYVIIAVMIVMLVVLLYYMLYKDNKESTVKNDIPFISPGTALEEDEDKNQIKRHSSESISSTATPSFLDEIKANTMKGIMNMVDYEDTYGKRNVSIGGKHSKRSKHSKRFKYYSSRFRQKTNKKKNKRN